MPFSETVFFRPCSDKLRGKAEVAQSGQSRLSAMLTAADGYGMLLKRYLKIKSGGGKSGVYSADAGVAVHIWYGNFAGHSFLPFFYFISL